MSTFAIFVAVFIFWIIKAGKLAQDNSSTRNTRTPQTSEEASLSRTVRAQARPEISPKPAQPYTVVPPRTASPEIAPARAQLGGVTEQKRAQMRDAGQWIEAKRQQDDARQLHSIRMDTCEGKLESLRVLYDAGILDREEYAQRVARVKAKHNER